MDGFWHLVTTQVPCMCVSTCMWSAPGTDISGTNQMAPGRRKMPLHGWRLISLFFELNGCFRRAARV